MIARCRWPGLSLIALTIAMVSCSRRSATVTADAGVAQPEALSSGTQACTTHDKIAAMPCRAGARKLDTLPPASGVVLELTHCPLDDCGSGGCSYQVYGLHQGCLRELGSVHGASIDVSTPDGGPPLLRTWGRSGTTHVATDYQIEAGQLVRRGQFVCDYGSGKPMPPQCPKL